MPVTGLNPEKCKQRNRLEAIRFGVNTAPVHFLRELPARGESEGLTSALGTLPRSNEDALERINALLPSDAPRLSLDDVYIAYAEVANNSFVSDRYAFLHSSTLRNIAQDAAQGIAFMNSHRVGMLSHPSELPYGRTFAGRYEKYASGTERTLMGFYMRRGIKPNGDSGPSTDDLYASIMAGTLFDVSIGLKNQGFIQCDVCGYKLRHTPAHDDRGCEHVPGSTRRMTEEQILAQQERGVKDGRASYTVVDDHAGELSGVYDGAVAGAGFQTALRFAKQRKLSPKELTEVADAYATLAAKGDFDMELVSQMMENAFTRALRRVFAGTTQAPLQFVEDADEPDDLDDTDADGPAEPVQADSDKQPAEPAPAPEPREEADQDEEQADDQPEQLGAQPSVADLQAQVRTLTEEKMQGEAATFAEGLVRDNKLLPSGKQAVAALYVRLSGDDAVNPASVRFTDAAGKQATSNRVELLRLTLSALPAHRLTEELKVGSVEGAVVLTGGRDEETQKAEDKAERDRVLSLTPAGRAILAREEAEAAAEATAAHSPARPARNGHRK